MPLSPLLFSTCQRYQACPQTRLPALGPPVVQQSMLVGLHMLTHGWRPPMSLIGKLRAEGGVGARGMKGRGRSRGMSSPMAESPVAAQSSLAASGSSLLCSKAGRIVKQSAATTAAAAGSLLFSDREPRGIRDETAAWTLWYPTPFSFPAPTDVNIYRKKHTEKLKHRRCCGIPQRDMAR